MEGMGDQLQLRVRAGADFLGAGGGALILVEA